MWSRGPRGEARPPKDPRNRWAVVRPSLPALRHGIDLDATVSASPRRTPARDDVRFRGKIGSHGQTVKMTRMTRSRHIGLSKAMALAHTGICQRAWRSAFGFLFPPPLLDYWFLFPIATSFKALSLASVGYQPTHPDRYCC